MDENSVSNEKITDVMNPLAADLQTFFIHTHMILFLGKDKNFSLIEARTHLDSFDMRHTNISYEY